MHVFNQDFRNPQALLKEYGEGRSDFTSILNDLYHFQNATFCAPNNIHDNVTCNIISGKKWEIKTGQFALVYFTFSFEFM